VKVERESSERKREKPVRKKREAKKEV